MRISYPDAVTGSDPVITSGSGNSGVTSGKNFVPSSKGFSTRSVIFQITNLDDDEDNEIPNEFLTNGSGFKHLKAELVTFGDNPWIHVFYFLEVNPVEPRVHSRVFYEDTKEKLDSDYNNQYLIVPFSGTNGAYVSRNENENFFWENY